MGNHRSTDKPMLFYRTLFLLATPFILFHLLWKSLQCGSWRYFAERSGLEYTELREKQQFGYTWFHCASVGEMRACLPLIEQYHAQHPDENILLTSNTRTSREVFERAGLPWLTHCYLPVDWRFAVGTFLKAALPSRCILFETEIWPNLIDLCAEQNMSIAVVNARLSDKSMRRAGMLTSIYSKAFDQITKIYTRSELDTRRFIELGADAERVETIGDIKLSGAHSANSEPQTTTDRDYILIVSTHAEEERDIAKAFAGSEELLVIAPRHPERSSAVASQLHALDLNIAMYSKQDTVNEDTDVLIIDVIGVLDQWYGGASIVIMGGTFTGIGGHNIIEPLSFHSTVLYGPDMHNFIEANNTALEYEASIQVKDIEELVWRARSLLDNKSLRKAYEANAEELMESLSSTMPAYLEKLG